MSRNKKSNLQKNSKQFSKKIFFTEEYFCKSCQVSLPNQALVKCHYMMHLFQKYDLPQNDIIKFDYSGNNGILTTCLYCKEKMISDKQFIVHMKSSKHQSAMEYLSSIKTENDTKLNKNNYLTEKLPKNGQFEIMNNLIISHKTTCKMCVLSFLKSETKHHVNSAQHRNNVLKFDADSIKAMELTAEGESTENDVIGNTQNYMCFICNKSFKNVLKLLQHYNYKSHQYVVAHLHEFVNNYDQQVPKLNPSVKKKTPKKRPQKRPQKRPLKSSQETPQETLEEIPEEKSKETPEEINSKEIVRVNKLLTKIDKFLKIESTAIVNDDVLLKQIDNFLGIESDSNESTNAHSNKTAKKGSRKKRRFNFTSKKASNDSFAVYNRLDRYRNNNFLIKVSETKVPDKSDEKELQSEINIENIISVDCDIKEISKLNQSEKTSKYEVNRNLFAFANTYVQLCINTGPLNIYVINTQTIFEQTLGYQFICSYRSELFCLLCKIMIAANEFNFFAHLRDPEHIFNFQRLYNAANANNSTELNLAFEFILKESDEHAYCYACDMTLENSTNHFYHHVKLTQHVQSTLTLKNKATENLQQLIAIYINIWYYAHVFCCYLCNMKFDMEIEFIIHLQCRYHIRKLEKCLHECKLLRFDVCLACCTYWYGTYNDYSEHCKTNMHKCFLTNLQFRCPNLLLNAKHFLNNIEEHAEELLKESDQIAISEQDQIQKLSQSLEKITVYTYPSVKAYLFGSRLSNTACLGSDVDIFLDCENMYYNAGFRKADEKYLKTVESLIEVYEDTWIIDENILQSRVPRLKLRHIETNLKCSLSFINGLNVEKSKLIRNYIAVSPICRQMILYLRKWLDFCGLSGSNGISTYALSWFVIFFLQNERILPSVYQLLQSKRNSNETIDGCYIAEEIPEELVVSTNEPLRLLLIKFFSLYNILDYRTCIICPILGKLVPKHCFANPHTLPDELLIYKQCLLKKEAEYFRLDSPMCIQDPIDHSQNMTKKISKFQLRCFREYCSGN